MKFQLSFAMLISMASVAVSSPSAASSSSPLCNRGYCYNKKDAVWEKQTPSLNGNKKQQHLMEADLLNLMGNEALECLNGDCPEAEERDLFIYEHDDDIDDLDVRKSWKDEPLRGTCYDQELGYTYDCQLIEILEDGMILIEDLRAEGHLEAHSKSDFSHSARKQKKRKANDPHLPAVMVVTGEDPSVDFRTNVELNMMGI